MVPGRRRPLKPAAETLGRDTVGGVSMELSSLSRSRYFGACRLSSNSTIPVATDTFRLSTDPDIGI